MATDPPEAAVAVGRKVTDLVAVLKEFITIPLAMKPSWHYSSLPHLSAQLDCIGADGLVLCNRSSEPDIHPHPREPVSRLAVSDFLVGRRHRPSPSRSDAGPHVSLGHEAARLAGLMGQSRTGWRRPWMGLLLSW